jgi:predicted dehydrogenase
VGGQHPLLIGVRPAWYFEEGKHGGAINDLSVHAFDAIRWITGMDFIEITAARSWNAFAKDFPHFHDGAQFMAKMENGCGVLGDMSYFMPDSQGRVIDQYWRLTLYGTKGVIETSYPRDTVWMARRDRNEPEIFQPLEALPGGYLQSFIREVNGDRRNLSPSSADSMRAAWLALTAQQVGYKGLSHVEVRKQSYE